MHTEDLRNELLDLVELEYFQNALRRQVSSALELAMPHVNSAFDGESKKVLEICTYLYRILSE